MRRIYGLVAVAVLAWVVTGCGTSLDKPQNEQAIGGEVVADLDGETIKQTLLAKGVPGVTEQTTVFGYKAYVIPYTTHDEKGQEVQASGLMAVPTGVPQAMEALGFSTVSDDHGTIFANDEAPSVVTRLTMSPQGAPLLFTALGGFVTLQPDYIGYGASKDHYHPFVQKRSLANATVDFIKAAMAFAQNNGIHLNGQLFITGYSEGGYAAMAALQKIENDGELHVALAVPMAGPYALDTMAKGVLSAPKLSVPSFMALVAYAYAKTYDKDVATMVNEPYAQKLPTLFDGSKIREAIDLELTTQTTGEGGLFRADFVHDFFVNPTNWFAQAVVDNSVDKWAPQTPVKLLHCQGDDVIPFAISKLTQASLQAYGAASVDLIPVEAAASVPVHLGHAQCATPAYMVAMQLFAGVRQATVGY